MAEKMPCHISDGPQEPDDVPEYIYGDPDDAYDEMRQRKLEDQIAEDHAREQAMNAVCTVCRKNYVNVMEGEDTCLDCTLPF